MIDNCYKYYQKDRAMIENLSRHTFNENTLNHVINFILNKPVYD